MNADTWNTCQDHEALIDSLQQLAKLAGSDLDGLYPRKLRLALCGVARKHWREFDRVARTAVITAEHFADNRTNSLQLRQADHHVTAWNEAGLSMAAYNAALWVASDHILSGLIRQDHNKQLTCDALKCVFGNPWLPEAPMITCPQCHGKGFIEWSVEDSATGGIIDSAYTCPECLRGG